MANINGWFTEYFNIEKGARQGDPIAAYLFILGAELLGRVIRIHQDIKGITLGNTEYKISQFADDTMLFLDGSTSSLDATMDVLEQFSKVSGLSIHLELEGTR